MLIKFLLKKYFLVVGTGLLASANAATLTIDNFMQYDRAIAGPGTLSPVYGNGATLPGGIQRVLSVQNLHDIVTITTSGGQLSSYTFHPSTGSSNSEYTYRSHEVEYTTSTPLNFLLGQMSVNEMFMSLHITTTPSFYCSISFYSGNDNASWNFNPGSNSSGLFSSSLGYIDSTFNWGSVDRISMSISTIPGGLISLGEDNLGFRVVSVPEPSTCFIFGLGAFLVVAYRRKAA